MKKPTYEELERQVRELRHLVNLKVYPQDIHFETRDLLYFRINRDWQFEFFDRRISELTGYNSEDFHNDDLTWLDIVHEKDREAVQDAVTKGMETDKFYQAEFRIVKKEGEIAWVKMRGPIFCNDAGEFMAFQGIMDDITSNRNMEMALASEHEVFAWVANNMEDGFYIVSSDYRIQFMNKALIDLVGDHVGEVCYRALFKRDSVCPWSVMDSIKQEICGFQEYDLADVGRIFQVRSFPLKRQDGTIGKLGQLKDITRARRLEGEIEDYAIQHRAIVDSANLAHLGIFIVQDRDGHEAHFRYVNEAFRAITGYSQEELLTKGILDLVHPGSIQKVLDRYRRRQRGESVDHAYEFKMCHKNGQGINVFISAAISSYDGKVATIGFLQDFTDRRKFEKSLWMSQRLASIGRLAAEVAHEINNPLTSVLTFAKLMDRICRQEPFPLERLTELRQYIAFLDSEATRCGEIARNLLDFSRHGDIDLKENDLHEILEKTLDVLRHRAQMNNIRIETSYNRDTPPLVCDFKRLQQAFVNLFWNAIEAMPQGGSLSVSTSFDRKKEVVRLTIADTGTGITEEDLESIFEPFFTTKADGKGVGLGLSVAYGIIRQHHGTIRAQSNVGRGTSFTVEFKLNAHTHPHSPEEPEISKGEGG